jgi:uroporphyrinogen III methyltransferase / synthase
VSGPLHGRRVVVTRSVGQASKLADQLRALGATIVLAPTIRFEPLTFVLPDDLDWVVVTSPNGIDALTDVAGAKLAVVGPGTAEAAAAAGFNVSLVPPRSMAESLVESFSSGPGRVAVVQADIARPVAVDGLRAKGWDVTPITAYRTLAVEAEPAVVEAIAAADAITFTSGSTVRSFVAAYGIDLLPETVVSIGPVTTDACTELGVRVTATAWDHNIDGLVAATTACLSERKG